MKILKIFTFGQIWENLYKICKVEGHLEQNSHSIQFATGFSYFEETFQRQKYQMEMSTRRMFSMIDCKMNIFVNCCSKSSCKAEHLQFLTRRLPLSQAENQFTGYCYTNSYGELEMFKTILKVEAIASSLFPSKAFAIDHEETFPRILVRVTSASPADLVAIQ